MLVKLASQQVITAPAPDQSDIWTDPVELGAFDCGAPILVVHHARGAELFVSGALQDGDPVVATGLHRLAPGQRVLTGDPSGLAAAN